MKAVFGLQEVLEVINNGIEVLPTNPINAQRNSHIDGKNKDGKTHFYIHKCVDNKVFEKIVDENTSMEVWNTLVKYDGGDAKVKKVRLQTLRR